MNTLSWSSPTTPLPTENNPRIVFERLFGDGGTAGERLAQARENQSILDSVNEESGGLLKTLGAADRHKLDDYVGSVREIERRIQAVEKAASIGELLATLERPMGIPQRFDEHVNLMFDMVWLVVPRRPHPRHHLHAGP